MQRVVVRELPSGTECNVYPFHVCLKGTESAVLCRDDEDYDVMVKAIAVCARRKDVVIVIYTVVSNHCHVVVLAASHSAASAFGEELHTFLAMRLTTGAISMDTSGQDTVRCSGEMTGRRDGK